LKLLAKLVLYSVLVSSAALASPHEKRRYAALPKASSMVTALADSKAPVGWADFCARHADECDDRISATAVIPATLENWKRIQDTNLDVNSTVQEASDLEVYGTQERWEYPTSGKGDCEDYALEKRKRLIKAGLPRQALLMTVVTDENGFGHAILTVRTTIGDFVLDNRVDRVLSWEATGYGFIKQQASDNPNHWVRLGGPSAPITTATAQR
jgi:hypothetical protein